MKVFVSSSEFPQVGIDILKRYEVVQSQYGGFDTDPAKLEAYKEEIKTLIKGVDAIVWCTKVFLGKELLDLAGPNLKVVTTMSAGVDQIDLNEIRSRNLVLGNTPDVLNHAVADVAILLMLAVARRLSEGILQIQSGEWEIGPQKFLGYDVNRKVAGIVGLGGIGQTIAKRLKGFDLSEILYCGHNPKEEADELNAKFVTFDELLERSDFVILSCPLTEKTKNMMNDQTFGKMKSTAILINVSRGGVVDQDALVRALKNKEIGGAGLDVMSPEPLPKDNTLVSLPNCFLTPHIGSATITTRNQMAELAALNAVLGTQGQPLLTPFPL